MCRRDINIILTLAQITLSVILSPSHPAIMPERNKFLEIVMERDSRPIVRKEDPSNHVSPHLMAKIEMIQSGLGTIDQSLDRIRSSIQNYSVTNICEFSRLKKCLLLSFHWPRNDNQGQLAENNRNSKVGSHDWQLAAAWVCACEWGGAKGDWAPFGSVNRWAI